MDTAHVVLREHSCCTMSPQALRQWKWHTLYSLQVGLYSVHVGLKFGRFNINQSSNFCLAHKCSKYLVIQFQRLHYIDTVTWLVRDTDSQLCTLGTCTHTAATELI